jgi:HD-like signal output (HDOD) protein
LKQFWRHSVATGVIGKILCNKLNVGRFDSLYLAGLVHDVGKVVLDRFVHDVYKQIVDLTYKENISILEAETRIMGASHDTVGGWLMEKWRLPPIFGEVARYHHSVIDAPEKSNIVVAIVNVADQLARLKGFGFGGDTTGVDFSITDSFKILEKKNHEIIDLDVFKLVWDLDGAHEEIEEMQRMVTG